MARADLNVSLGLITKSFEKSLKKSQRQLERFGRNLSSVGRDLTAGLTLPIVGAGVAAVRSAANFEQLQTELSVLTGSAEAGAQAFERLVQFSSKTPLRLDDLVRANNTLIGFGLSADDAFNSLQQLGDLSGGSSERLQRIAVAFGQVAASGRLTAQDINQFVNNGVPLLKLFEEAGIASASAVKQLASEGKIGLPELQAAISAATSEGGQFFGLLESQSQTLGGVLSTLADNLNIAASEIGKTVAESLNLQENVGRLTTFIQDAVKAFDRLDANVKKNIVTIAAVAAVVGPLLVTLGGIVRVLPLIGGAITALSGPVGVFIAVIGGLGAAFVGLANELGGFDEAIIFIEAKFESLIARFKAIAIEIGKLRSPLGILSVDLKNIGRAGDAVFENTLRKLADQRLFFKAFSEARKADVQATVTPQVQQPVQPIGGGVSAPGITLPDALSVFSSLTDTLENSAIDNFVRNIEKARADTAGIAANLADGIVPSIEALPEKPIQLFTENMERAANAVANVLGPSLDAMFEAILTKGEDAFKAFTQVLKNTLKELIKVVLQAAVLAGILSLFTGGATFGTFFKKFLGGGGIPQFAEGGIVTGPTRALVGEAGPEAIIPLSQLNRLGIGGGNLELKASIRGSDLLLAIERANIQTNRIRG